MEYRIIEASPEAKAKIEVSENAKPAFVNEHHRTKYPIDELNVGQCFVVPVAEANEVSLRLTSYKVGKKSGKKFCVIKHKDYGLVEVARIA